MFFHKSKVKHQTPETPKADRTDHVWIVRPGGGYKCVICGGVTKTPPHYPTPKDWMPDGFELPLTPTERQVCPYVPVKLV